MYCLTLALRILSITLPACAAAAAAAAKPACEMSAIVKSFEHFLHCLS